MIVKQNDKIVTNIDNIFKDLPDGVEYRLAASGYEPGTKYKLLSYCPYSQHDQIQNKNTVYIEFVGFI